jgi:hypothetical protein
MYHNIRLAGYYWPGIMADCLKVAKTCHGCQIDGNFKHLRPMPLHPMVPSWPFDAWGMDVIGPIDPPSSGGHRFILAATDYFSKWAEAVPLREIRQDAQVHGEVQNQVELLHWLLSGMIEHSTRPSTRY